ncbi:MAG: HAD hydrolase-like protein, partial [Puniceicoccales bacterium]
MKKRKRFEEAGWRFAQAGGSLKVVNPRNLLFDLDGTLTDPKPGITGCLQYAMEKMGRRVPPAEELLWCIGPPLQESLATLLEDDSIAVGEEALRHYRERFST